MTDDLLLTREEVLGGLPARRAAALLYLIESRTAHLVERARQSMQPFRSEVVARERDLAFVEAFALGREPPLRPSIQDLERHAPQWSDLVPANPRMRAAVGRLLGQKYRFTERDVPALRRVLGLDDVAVRQAYERLYREPLLSIYTSRPSLATRLRWYFATLGDMLENLPPFWTAFALTLTETVGAGILALPIALSGVGPIPGIILLVVLGLVNVVTVAWMAETTARTASVRYGGAYFGRLVTQYLGSAGSALLTIALAIANISLLLAYAIGLSTTLSGATGVAGAVWIVLLFAVVSYLVSRDTINSTVVSALAIGATNIMLVLVLAGLGFAHLNMGNLERVDVPGLGDMPFDLTVVGLIFGVILSSYFGHTSIGNCAAIVLQRDPSARSLIWGVVAAQGTAVVVYAIWVLAINGAISQEALSGQAGTALGPLADVAGPSVHVVGSAFVVLAMGMGAVHRSLGLVNIVRERLPRRSQPVVLLPRTQGRLVFEPTGNVAGRGPRFVLTYLGLAGGQPSLRLLAHTAGRTQRLDRKGGDLWAAREEFDHLPDEARRALDLTIQVMNADEQQVRLQVISGMSMRYEGSWTSPGLDLTSLLETDSADHPHAGDDQALLRWMLRQGNVSAGDVAAWTGQDENQAQQRLRALVERGAAREVAHNGAPGYRANVARRRGRSLPVDLQQAMNPDVVTPRRSAVWTNARDRLRRSVASLLGDHGRRLLEFSPLVLMLVTTEWLVLTDRASFTSVLGFTGVIAVPIFAGLFPCLLLVSSRRNGDLAPGMVVHLLGRAWLTAGVFILFLGAIVLHGLVIWTNPVERASAILAGIVMLGVTVLAIRRGAFDRRTVVVLRDDQRPGGESALGIVSGGEPVITRAELDHGDGVHQVEGATVPISDFATIQRITVGLPEDGCREIKVWANRITPDAAIENLPVIAILGGARETKQVDVRLAGGDVLLTPGGTPQSMEFLFNGAVPAEPPTAGGGVRTRRPRVDLQSLFAPDVSSDEQDPSTTSAQGE